MNGIANMSRHWMVRRRLPVPQVSGPISSFISLGLLLVISLSLTWDRASGFLETPIHGAVLDTTGKPQESARVTAYLTRTNSIGKLPESLASTRSGPDGVFRFGALPVPSLPKGTLWFVAESEDSMIGGNSVAREHLAHLSEKGLNIVIAEVKPFSGQILADGPLGPKDVVISIASVNPGRTEKGSITPTLRFPPGHHLPGLHARCSPDGHFDISGVGDRYARSEAEVTVSLYVDGEGLATGPYPIPEVSWTKNGRRLKPFRSSSITGRVVCEDSSAVVEGLHVRIHGSQVLRGRDAEYPFHVMQSITTDRKGEFRLPRLPRGEYSLELVREPDLQWTHRNPRRKYLAPGQDMEVELKLIKGQVLIGEVVDEHGRQVKGAALSIDALDAWFRTKSDDDGKFNLRVPSGDYRIEVTSVPGPYKPRDTLEYGPRFGPDVLVHVPEDKAPVFVRFKLYRTTYHQEKANH